MASATIPSNAKERKERPIGTGVIDYFPDAIAAVAHVSFIGNQQHNPGSPLHWDRTKSTDEADCLMRHFVDRGTFDSDGIRHSAKMAWRALALLQKEIEAEAAKEESKDWIIEFIQSKLNTGDIIWQKSESAGTNGVYPKRMAELLAAIHSGSGFTYRATPLKKA